MEAEEEILINCDYTHIKTNTGNKKVDDFIEEIISVYRKYKLSLAITCYESFMVGDLDEKDVQELQDVWVDTDLLRKFQNEND
jgi:hypothetical protein